MKFLSLLSHKPTSLGGLVAYLCPDMLRGVYELSLFFDRLQTELLNSVIPLVHGHPYFFILDVVYCVVNSVPPF